MSIFSKKEKPLCPLCQTTISFFNKRPVADGFICYDCMTRLGLKDKELSNISITTLIAPAEKRPFDERCAKPVNENFSEAREIAKLSVFLYWVRKGKAISNDKNYYPQYFKYNYGIENCVTYHESLLTDGYLQKPDFHLQLKALKVTELKEILQSLNLSQGGKKEVLVNRILEQGNPEFVNQFIGETDLYVLSQKGLDFLNEHFDYVELHRCGWGIEFNEYQSMKVQLQKVHIYNFNEIAKAIFNNLILKYSFSKEYGLLRNAHSLMAQLLLKENKEGEAFKYNVLVLFFDLNVGYYPTIACRDNWFASESEKQFKDPFIPPGSLRTIQAKSEHYCAMEIESALSTIHLPYIIISKKSYIRLLEKVISSEEDCIDEFLPEMRRNFEKYMK